MQSNKNSKQKPICVKCLGEFEFPYKIYMCKWIRTYICTYTLKYSVIMRLKAN